MTSLFCTKLRCQYKITQAGTKTQGKIASLHYLRGAPSYSSRRSSLSSIQSSTSSPCYEQHRHERPDRRRGIGGGRKYDLPLVSRIAMVLTYLRAHVIQALVAKLFGASQSDVSRDLPRLVPLLKQVLPCPEVWELVESEQPLTQEQRLKLADLVDGQVLIDATEQQIYRSKDSTTRKAAYSGKKTVHP